MKQINNYIQEKLILNKTVKTNKCKYYILLGVYEGFDYLVDNFGDFMIVGDKGSGPSIFIATLEVLLDIDKEYFENKSITIWKMPEKYENNIDQFEKDYYDGKINLEDNSYELDENEINKIIK